MLTKQAKYYWDQDSVRVDHSREWWTEAPPLGPKIVAERSDGGNRQGLGTPAGRNLWNYWVLPPDPYPGAHFATFPRETRGPIAERFNPKNEGKLAQGLHSAKTGLCQPGWRKEPKASTKSLGWQPGCRCGPDAGVRPCVVLDPFSGSGTSAYVAAQLGRVGIGVELSAEYIKQARYGRLAQDFLPFGVPPALALEGAG
jgi:site-specific DNA-methyltransferase (adenine-specific)